LVAKDSGGGLLMHGLANIMSAPRGRMDGRFFSCLFASIVLSIASRLRLEIASCFAIASALAPPDFCFFFGAMAGLLACVRM
jgi:hypothetical protein